jgi:high-affinity iron transporter
MLTDRKLLWQLIFTACIGAPLAAQARPAVPDSLAIGRRIVAAAQLAAKEYSLGVPAAGGRVTEPEEVKEAVLFVEQARVDVAALPGAVRSYADSALRAMQSAIERTVPPQSIAAVADALAQRIELAMGGKVLPVPARPPSVAGGARVYRQACASCHGEAGHGDGLAARGLTPPPANLTDPQIMGAKSRADIYQQLLLGVAGTAMPSFEGTLTDEQRWDVAAYALTLQYGGSADAAVFAAVRRQLDSAVASRSDRVAFDAYLTFEQVENEVRARNAGLAARLEGGFARLRQRAQGGASSPELGAIRNEILSDLENAERLVTDRASGANLFVQSILLLVREGFEAILIIAALMTFLTRAGAPSRRREVAVGAWAAVGASVVTAVLLELLLETTPGQREALEGFTMLLAVVVLFYVSYWLLSKIEADKWSAFLKSRMQSAISSESTLALASVAFLAVYREGVETILFYKALLVSGGAGDAGVVLGGVAAGAVVLVGLYVAIMRLGVRIPMKPFFAVTGALLYYMAFVFAGKGIAELQEGGLVATTVIPSLDWLRVPFLGIYPTAQSLALQGVLLVLAAFAVVLMRRSGGTPSADGLRKGGEARVSRRA